MRIYWKALITYGILFWIILCFTDFLGLTNIYKYRKGIPKLIKNLDIFSTSPSLNAILNYSCAANFMNYPDYFNKLIDELDELYEKPLIFQQEIEPLKSYSNKIKFKGIKLGWSLIIWNFLTFIFSILMCSVANGIACLTWNLYRSNKMQALYSKIITPNSYLKNSGSFSRIPVMVKTIPLSSETNLAKAENSIKIDKDKSCPNLLMERSRSNLSTSTDLTTKTCRTLFRKDLYFAETSGLSNEQQTELQCKRLKEELHRLQTTSLKEHAMLSRKLESVNKDKKDISKQLMIAQKENRAAKQQLEELVQEKNSLLRKLEVATKEFKCNTKTKKFALAKLEEVTNNVDELRQQLEQVSRDKEILAKKLRLLEVEYNKLHERYIASQQRIVASNNNNNNNNNDNLPERDFNNENNKKNYLDKFGFPDSENNIPPALQQTANVLASVSQTELDMKKIQEKIKQLEKNLDNLDSQNNNEYNPSRSFDQLESEISLSAIENTTDSQNRIEDGSRTTFSELSSGNSPRPKHWSDRVVELVGKNKHQFAKIQALASKMQEKARFLGNIREKAESTEEMDTTDDSDDPSEPKRLVSSSVAFKNFLKSLNKLDAAKKEISSNPEVYF